MRTFLVFGFTLIVTACASKPVDPHLYTYFCEKKEIKLFVDRDQSIVVDWKNARGVYVLPTEKVPEPRPDHLNYVGEIENTSTHEKKPSALRLQSLILDGETIGHIQIDRIVYDCFHP